MDSSSAVYYNKITRGVMVYAIYYELMVVGPLAMCMDAIEPRTSKELIICCLI